MTSATSSNNPQRRQTPLRRRRMLGFTLIEMMTTVAILIILLGLMVSLARRVRNVSATDVTKELLQRLEAALTRYVARDPSHSLPPVPLVVQPGVAVEEIPLRARAWNNNQALMELLRQGGQLAATDLQDVAGTHYSRGTLRDAWGSPIVFMPRFDRSIGMALEDRPFFFSAGPDRLYLTREDNLYSYEDATE